MIALLDRLDDRLSPMLVKELRQGIKSRAFAISFMLMQGLMVFCVLMYLLALDNASDRQFFDALFWACVSIPLVLIMPMRGNNAIQGEVKEKTLELILLTRLSAWRIILGKWASLFTQTLLIACAILPYAVLRYFLGSVNVAENLLTLGFLRCVSSLLTAASVACSTLRLHFVRGLYVLVFIFGFNIIPGLLFGGMSRSSSLFGSFGVLTLVSVVAFTGLLSLLFLQWGAGRIAPQAENHDSRKRITTLIIILVAFIVAKLGGSEHILYLSLAFLIPVCVDALCSQPRALPSLYVPFGKRGFFARFVGRHLYPGWPSGFLYSALTLTLLFLMIASEVGFTERLIVIFVSLVGAICLPLSLILLVRPRTEKLMAAYTFIQIGLVVLFSVTSGVHAAYANFPIEAVKSIPIAAFVSQLVNDYPMELFPITAGISGVSALVLAFLMVRPLRHIGQLELAVTARTSGGSAPAVPPPLPPQV